MFVIQANRTKKKYLCGLFVALLVRAFFDSSYAVADVPQVYVWSEEHIVSPKKTATSAQQRLQKEKQKQLANKTPPDQIKQILSLMEADLLFEIKGTCQQQRLQFVASGKRVCCDAWSSPRVFADKPLPVLSSDPMMHGRSISTPTYSCQIETQRIVSLKGGGTLNYAATVYNPEDEQESAVDALPGMRCLFLGQPLADVRQQFVHADKVVAGKHVLEVERVSPFTPLQRQQNKIAPGTPATINRGKVRLTLDSYNRIASIERFAPPNSLRVTQRITVRYGSPTSLLPLSFVSETIDRQNTVTETTRTRFIQTRPASAQESALLNTPFMGETDVLDYRLGLPPVVYRARTNPPPLEKIRPLQRREIQRLAKEKAERQRLKTLMVGRLVAGGMVFVGSIAAIVLLRRRWRL